MRKLNSLASSNIFLLIYNPTTSEEGHFFRKGMIITTPSVFTLTNNYCRKNDSFCMEQEVQSVIHPAHEYLNL